MNAAGDATNATEGSTGECQALVVTPSTSHVTPSGVALHAAQATSTYGMAHTGSIVWDASRALADYMDALFGLQPTRMEGLRVLELGAGVSAFPSQICAHLGAEVTATDHDQVALLAENMKKLTPCVSWPLSVQQLDWSSPAAGQEIPARYDIVLCADVLYEQTWKDLLQFFLALFKADQRVVVYMCNTNRKAVHLFHRKMLLLGLENGLVVERIESSVLDCTHVLWRMGTCSPSSPEEKP